MYIPKGKIDPKVYYTSGREYFYSTTLTSYVGYYHLDLYGRAWSGKEHTNESIRLITQTNSPLPENVNKTSKSSIVYTGLVNNSKTTKPLLSSPIPSNDSLPPTIEDYEKTYYTRYILEYKLSSQPIFIEVNKTTYFGIVNTPQNTYFNYVEVPWKISGPLNDVKENGILMQGGIIETNQRSIQEANKKVPGINKYLTDLLLYAVPLEP